MSRTELCEDRELSMPRRSRYRGQTVDTSSRHSIEILSGHRDAKLIDASDTHVMVDHFFHQGRFWRARIPLDGVDAVYGQIFNFSKPKTKRGQNGPEIVRGKDGLPKRSIPTLNHLQCRFKLKPGKCVELFPRETSETDDPDHQLNDFVYSLEAVGPKGVRFNMRDGLTGSLISAHRFLSTQEMVFERIVVEGQYVTESPAVPLGDAQKKAALCEALLRSHEAGMSEPYYLYRICGTNNCTSTPFQILDRVADYNWRQRIGSWLYRLPLNPRLYLRVRGLDSDPGVRKLVRNEFEAYIQNSETQRRKREFVRQRARKTSGQ